MSQRKAGLLQLQANGEVYQAKGDFTYNHGGVKREAIIGADGIHGYKEMPIVPFIEGEITDSLTLDVAVLKSLSNATVSLGLANGKMFVLRSAWFASEGDVNTGEGNIAVRFEGLGAEEVS